MSKIILILSLFAITILLFLGMVDPNNSIMWLASTTHQFTLVRLILIGLLASLLILDPPSNVYLRSFVIFLSLGLVGWSLTATYQNHMNFLDSLTLLQTSVAASLSTLETEPETTPTWDFQRFTVLYNSAAEYLNQHFRPHIPLRG
jgi:hypothetical protein